MDNFCKIYFTNEGKLDSIKTKVNDLFFAKNLDVTQIYYEDNLDYDRRKETEFPDGFLFFKYIIDIELGDELEIVIPVINDILNLLWEQNIPAIAVCDYEDELIKKGGYKDKSIPFKS